MDPAQTAQINRSLRTIRTELEYLTDTAHLTPLQLTHILSLLPSQTPLHAPILTSTSPTPISSPVPPTSQFASTSLTEKLPQPSNFHNRIPSPTPPPPAYAPSSHSIAMATSLYAYTPTDAGDLSLLPNDRVAITQFMNADWAKGRNERTGQEGIFPRSYVNVIDEKSSAMIPPPPAQVNGTGYGNMPVEVAQNGGGAGGTGEPNKLSEGGKKFGKKMGNAAIFGAGATIGSNIVNSIF